MVDLDVFEFNCVCLNNRESMHNYTFPYEFSLEEAPTKERNCECECDNRKQKGKREHRQLGGAAKIERERNEFEYAC